jgi:hypothetical protein
MKKSKEQLIAELATIRVSHEEWVSGDLKRRDTLTQIILGYSGHPNSYTAKAPTLSWLEIAAEIGKLLNIKTAQGRDEYIRQLEQQNSALLSEKNAERRV